MLGGRGRGRSGFDSNNSSSDQNKSAGFGGSSGGFGGSGRGSGGFGGPTAVDTGFGGDGKSSGGGGVGGSGFGSSFGGGFGGGSRGGRGGGSGGRGGGFGGVSKDTAGFGSGGGGGFGDGKSSGFGRGSGSDSGCRKCGEDGHFARGDTGGRGGGFGGKSFVGGANGGSSGSGFGSGGGFGGESSKQSDFGGSGRGRGRGGGSLGGNSGGGGGFGGSDAKPGGGGFGGSSSGEAGSGFDSKPRDFPSGGGSGFGDSKPKDFGSGGGGGFGGEKADRVAGGGDGCRSCGQSGHFARECPTADNSCRNCKQDGHMARECPNPPKCNRCKGDGHRAADCTEPRAEGEPPAPVTYVPEKVEAEDLFDEHIPSGLNFNKFDDIQVERSGKTLPEPFKSFMDAKFPDLLYANIKKSGYSKPTPVQRHAMPVVMKNMDLMACAQTGSGKTAAFLLPILSHVMKTGDVTGELSEVQCPLALVIAPTRELAVQIEREARKFASESIARTVCLYGGVRVSHHVGELRKGCVILVGTPGRLKHFINEGIVSVSKIKFVVLDEADRMLDEGFEPEIREILSSRGLPSKEERQTVMFSATFPPTIQELARDFMKPDSPFIAIGIVGSANQDIEQTIIPLDAGEKKDKLLELLSADIANAKGPDGKYKKKTLVFVEMKRTADFVAGVLSQSEHPSTSIHGDRLQQQREEALREFRTGVRPILIATSVAARGLDIIGVDHVINYDLPKCIDDFVHRVGRTGRVGNPGRATSFYDEEKDGSLADALVKVLRDAQQVVPDWLLSKVGQGSGGGGFGSASNGAGFSGATPTDFGGASASAANEDAW